jgi:DNA-binding protein HU-beta
VAEIFKMNKLDLIRLISKDVDIHQYKVEQVIDSFLENIQNALTDGDFVKIIGFGKFEIEEKSARKGVNPKTREEIIIPRKKAPKFSFSQEIKNKVNKE